MNDKHQATLAAMGTADLQTLVDPDFLARHQLNPPGQYGIVCKDVKAAISKLEDAGAGPFVYARTPAPNWVEGGTTRQCRVEMGMGYTGGQQIEILGPGEGTAIYREKIPADGSMALHHVCIFQPGIAAIEDRLNQAGFATVVAGHTGIKGLFTTRFKYFDTRQALGFYLEVTEYLLLGRHAPPGPGLINRLGGLQRRLGR